MGIDGRHQPHLPRLARCAASPSASPSALWINEGREYLVDGSGRVLSALKKGTKVRLPRFSGAGAPEQAQVLLDLIVRFPRIAERFEMAERVGEPPLDAAT